MAHCLMNRDRVFGFEGDEAVEGSVSEVLPLFESFRQHEAVSITRQTRESGEH